MDTNQLLVILLLYIFLPLWGIAGFADWCCHRATRIELTSGVRESLMHSMMGIQIAIPILLCLLFYINVLVLLICLGVWVLHEVIAHRDVKFAAPKREISIWEMHAHNYLATLPLYMMSIIFVLNWPTVIKLFSLDWQGEMMLQRLPVAQGGETYLPFYLIFMAAFCVFPYAEELLRCLIAKHRGAVSS